uniref:Ig-like domain-containing protein n=1 Tax=Ficedula albicollis TaxID=59894 RepID=U3KDF6_FICAL
RPWLPCPCPAVPSPVVALAGWCPLSPAGAQSTQLLVEPPWTPAVLWDRVTLTCQGSGTAGATTWYKNLRRWGQERRDSFTVTENGTYTCDKPGSGLNSPVLVSNGEGVSHILSVGDTVTLRCRSWQDNPVTRVRFYEDERDLGESLRGTELSLSPLELHNSGRYRCGGFQEQCDLQGFAHGLVLEGPPELPEGSPLNLSCLSTPSPLRPRAPLLYRFYRDGQLVGGPQGSPQLLVPAVGVSHPGNYSCEVRSQGGPCGRAAPGSASRCAVRVLLSGVSLLVQPPGGQVALGDRLVLSCTVAMGTGPLSFSWHRGGMNAPMGTGPRLELQHVGYNDSGHYQCRVSDGDNVVESPTLNITVLGEWDPWAGGDPNHSIPNSTHSHSTSSPRHPSPAQPSSQPPPLGVTDQGSWDRLAPGISTQDIQSVHP